ncbi:hypothetical protein Baya_0119 [Bagarius yarrelli]|uniref:Uncharacterized protein n=1 Tax=Bagarius yarrelli TaxID=175774 RepID=A0A556THB3_BAGYA|nr:hypothetical protein Baya_0119 [Bagarius yarrelli]
MLTRSLHTSLFKQQQPINTLWPQPGPKSKPHTLLSCRSQRGKFPGTLPIQEGKREALLPGHIAKFDSPTRKKKLHKLGAILPLVSRDVLLPFREGSRLYSYLLMGQNHDPETTQPTTSPFVHAEPEDQITLLSGLSDVWPHWCASTRVDCEDAGGLANPSTPAAAASVGPHACPPLLALDKQALATIGGHGARRTCLTLQYRQKGKGRKTQIQTNGESKCMLQLIRAVANCSTALCLESSVAHCAPGVELILGHYPTQSLTLALPKAQTQEQLNKEMSLKL